MMSGGQGSNISISFGVEGFLSPQTEHLLVQQKQSNLFIGIPKETTLQENRVALVPSSVALLTSRGHRVVLESGAGLAASFTDHAYSEAGAEIVYDAKTALQANIVLKVAPPTIDELDCFHHHQTLVSPLQSPIISGSYLEKLYEKGTTALAMEFIKDDKGSFPVVRVMSEIAGVSAVLSAAELLSKDNNGVGVLLGGIAGVPPAKVVILGAGVVGEFAARSALGLGAEVRIFDNNIYKLMRLQNQIGRQLYTSALDPVTLGKELESADAVIGAIHSSNGRAPMVVSENMVARMKPNSVIIDVSIDQGGCFETSALTSHDSPTFRHLDVLHYCVPNIASRVPRTASMAISNIITPMLLRTEATNSSFEALLNQSVGLRNGVYTYKGRLTNHYLAERFNLKYTPIDLLLMNMM